MDFLMELNNDINEMDKEKIKNALENYFINHVKNNDFIGIVCECNKEAISTAFLAIYENPANTNFTNGRIGTLLNVYTYPKYRKNGISTNIIKTIIEEAKEQNVSVIDLMATNDGEKIYRKFGFKEPKHKSMRLKILM
jgi:predicted acetyltransferase